jgi:menaquinone-dependent protoporphyrinogen oxidase
MNILVAVASKHGGTREIAEAIGQELRESGRAARVRIVSEVRDVGRYDAAIVGSAIYMGNWLADAQQFVERHRADLSALPVWLFSSGPLGQDDFQPRGEVAHLQELLEVTQARGHRTFVGTLDKREFGLGERLVARMVKAPEGDFRDWEAIRAWTREIAAALPSPTAFSS